MTTEPKHRQPPAELIAQRAAYSVECERRVRKALARLVKTEASFTVEDVCKLAGVGKTFVYDKRRPELTRAILAARDASQAAKTRRSEQALDEQASSWRERALNVEALVKTLRSTIKDREDRIGDLTGQLYDPEGNHLVEKNAELRKLVSTLSMNLRDSEIERGKLRRSLDAARANVRRERERNVTELLPREGAAQRSGTQFT